MDNTLPSAGHIGIAVPDVYKASERFEKLGVNFVKKPDDGTCMMRLIKRVYTESTVVLSV